VGAAAQSSNTYISISAAKADAQENAAGAASGTTVTTTGTPIFAATDVGKLISVAGRETTIAAYVNPNQVTTSTAVKSGCTGSCPVFWGTDNTTPINLALNTALSTNIAFGATFFLPAGAYLISGSTPIQVQNGSTLTGAGQSNSVIYAVGLARDNIIKLGQGSGGTGGTTAVVGIGLEAPNDPSSCDVTVGTAGNWAIRDMFFLSGGIGICGGGTTGLIQGNTFDSNLFNGISLAGNGADPNDTTHGISILDNMLWGLRYSCIRLEGVTDILISQNQLSYCKQFGIYGSTTATSRRVRISDNQFLTSTDPSFYTNTQTFIYFHANGPGGLADSSVDGNTFASSRQSDIELNGTGTANNLIQGNTFVNSSQSTKSGSPLASIVIQNVGSNRNTIRNNAWSSPGGYAIKALHNGPHITGNDISGAFALSGVPLALADSGAIWLNGPSGASPVVRDNQTADAGYPIVSIDAGDFVYSSDNQSGNATYDVYAAGSPTILTVNERVVGAFSAGSTMRGTPTIPGIRSITGTRYVCVNSSGTLVSSATACSGT
jgi:hypothetical protein